MNTESSNPPTARLRKAMNEIAARKGDFTFFGLLLRADAPATWDLVVAAPWLQKGRLKALTELAALLRDSIGEQALSELARIVTIDTQDPRLADLLKSISVEEREIRLKSTDLFGLDIEDAIILRSKLAA